MSDNNYIRLQRAHPRLLIPDLEDSEDSKTLGPIIGYAQEPLLSLAKACEPLVLVVDHISGYITEALANTPDDPADGLTRDESASIRLYTMEWTGESRSLYSILNHTLSTADRESLRPWFKYLKLFLTALAKIQCEPPTIVWRGVQKNVSDEYPLGRELVRIIESSPKGTEKQRERKEATGQTSTLSDSIQIS
ncbi:unnamed protein product [Rotaria sp. Silwood1]|nr:unnamed protein product [Rotaria sp. Silwood1]CAF3854467.1 unnamed protein product [Rotaria sp. Silwood1]CAF3862572.1 unnamed protein product [Rotaria sp. Silwood1]CAF4886411.1 unnamed protein product [Rotaria sp. Silwood1]CAF4966199.1 unnamed protein product [Rotaria sp. Silwood1]